jgi:hypothetical protein
MKAKIYYFGIKITDLTVHSWVSYDVGVSTSVEIDYYTIIKQLMKVIFSPKYISKRKVNIEYN